MPLRIRGISNPSLSVFTQISEYNCPLTVLAKTVPYAVSAPLSFVNRKPSSVFSVISSGVSYPTIVFPLVRVHRRCQQSRIGQAAPLSSRFLKIRFFACVLGTSASNRCMWIGAVLTTALHQLHNFPALLDWH